MAMVVRLTAVLALRLAEPAVSLAAPSTKASVVAVTALTARDVPAAVAPKPEASATTLVLTVLPADMASAPVTFTSAVPPRRLREVLAMRIMAAVASPLSAKAAGAAAVAVAVVVACEVKSARPPTLILAPSNTSVAASTVSGTFAPT